MKKTTILFVDHAPVMGGAERSLLLLMGGLDKVRFNVVLACPAGSELAREAARAGARVVDVDLGRLRGIKNPLTVASRLLSGFRQLLSAAKVEKAEIIHSNVMRASIYAVIVAKLTGARFVWHVRDIHKESFYKAIMARMADRIVAISFAVRDSLPKSTWGKTEVIYNALDLRLFESGKVDPQSFRRSIGVADNEILFGNVGWIAPWKRIELFLEAGTALIQRLDNVKLMVVGDPADQRYVQYFDDVKKSYEGLLGNRIIWAGARSNIAEVMASLDVLVHTADNEPFGRVIIEAMAMGKPVIAPNSGGPEEIVVDNRTGILFESGDVKSLERAMLQLLEMPEQAKIFGLAGAQRVNDLFTLDSQAKKIEHLYDELTNIDLQGGERSIP